MNIEGVLSNAEYLRAIAFSRSVIAKPDRMTGEFMLSSPSGIISTGYASREDAYEDFLREDPLVDTEYLRSADHAKQLRVGDTVKLGNKMAEIFAIETASGLVEAEESRVSALTEDGKLVTARVAEVFGFPSESKVNIKKKLDQSIPREQVTFSF